MANCYLCDVPLTEGNSSLEHIIPNSIGGRLKSRDLICVTCNNETGLLMDAAFARFGNILSSKYNIKRETGAVPNLSATDLNTGESLVVRPGYKLDLVEPTNLITEEGISVFHHDRRRAVEELKRLSKPVDGKEIDEESIAFEITPDNTEKQILIDILIEPNLLLRSVCKTIINLYVYKTGERDNCQHLLTFLREELENRFCWFLDYGVVKSRHDAPYHVILIRGNKRSKIIYGYFEMFGEAGFIAVINGQYNGPDFEINYTFDPINGKEVESDYDFKLKAADIFQHLLAKPESEFVKVHHH